MLSILVIIRSARSLSVCGPIPLVTTIGTTALGASLSLIITIGPVGGAPSTRASLLLIIGRDVEGALV